MPTLSDISTSVNPSRAQPCRRTSPRGAVHFSYFAIVAPFLKSYAAFLGCPFLSHLIACLSACRSVARQAFLLCALPWRCPPVSEGLVFSRSAYCSPFRVICAYSIPRARAAVFSDTSARPCVHSPCFCQPVRGLLLFLRYVQLMRLAFSPVSFSHLCIITSQYLGSSSMTYAFRPFCSQAINVVPLPPKRSSTQSPPLVLFCI